jgi:tetratricopeptide (TPR) repeat protein
MVEPLSGDSSRNETLTNAEREARIEHLLVAGLDEYFAGRMDQAINIWTRVLFLDRTSDRARAYIDRARRAQGERHREAEALVHQGLHAFDRGDVEQARILLTAAVDRGASYEQALPVLHRIGLLDVAPSSASTEASRGLLERGGTTASSRQRRTPWLVAGAVALAAGLSVWLAYPGSSVSQAPAVFDLPSAALPVPAASDAALARARHLFEAGKLPDALSLVERIHVGDAAYGEAQGLRAQIQQRLLGAADVRPGERSRP